MNCSGEKTGNNLFILAFAVGIMMRFFVMAMGSNYDFESYQIVGRIISEGGNVYAQTSRYNYAFLFSLFQGVGYSACSHLIEKVLTFRIYIVSFLTLADLGIAFFLKETVSEKAALYFFLNPVSVIITGFHNQFDNIAVFLALMSVLYFDESDSFTRRDLVAILFLTLSLLMKHILYLFFLWLLLSRVFCNLKKRMLYTCVPPAIFLVSFIPFAVSGKKAIDGIFKNVFFYRSHNNFPLLAPLLKILSIPDQFYFLISIMIMLSFGILFRKKSYGKLLLLYFCSLVAFSSAVANQYLVIPMAVLAACRRKVWYWSYSILFTAYSIINANEFDMAWVFNNRFPGWSSFFGVLGREGGIMVFIMIAILAVFTVVDGGDSKTEIIQ